MKRTVFAVFLAVATLSHSVRADEVTLESVAPVVVKTVPMAGADEVDPKATEIKITFSKDMMDGSYTLGFYEQQKDQFPTIDGKPKYLADKRTLTVPVKLEAGKTYALWVNTANLTGFKDVEGRPALPYLLVFRTKK